MGGVVAGNAVQSGSPSRTAAIVSDTVVPVAAGRPVSISYNTQPNDQMSVRLSSGSPRACSGLMYAAVPSRPWEFTVVAPLVAASRSRSGALSALAFASPKSSTLTMPSAVILMLAGLRSRWMKPFSCAASSARATSRAIVSVSDMPSPCCASPFADDEDVLRRRVAAAAISSASVRPSTSSSTRPGVPLMSAIPWIAQMFGWLNDARTRASRSNRRRRSGSATKIGGRILIATSRPSVMSRAR